MSKEYMSNGKSNYSNLHKKQGGLVFCRLHEVWFLSYCEYCEIDKNE